MNILVRRNALAVVLYRVAILLLVASSYHMGKHIHLYNTNNNREITMREFVIQSIINIIMKVHYPHDVSYSKTYLAAEKRLKKDLSTLPDKTLWEIDSTMTKFKHDLEYTLEHNNKKENKGR